MTDASTSAVAGAGLPRATRGESLAIGAGIIAGVAIFLAACAACETFRPEDAALGLRTVPRREDAAGVVRCFGVDLAAAARRFRALRKEGRPVVLWLGASQLYAVNEWRPGEEASVVHAERETRARGLGDGFVQIGLPNATLIELLLAALRLAREGLTPDRLVLAMVYDDLRETEIRPELSPQIPPSGGEDVRRWGPGVALLEEARAAFAAGGAGARAPVERNDIAGTWQDRLERRVTAGLEAAWPAFAARHRVSTRLEIWFRAWPVYVAGRTLDALGIALRRVPPVPAEAKRRNVVAFDSLLRLARASDAAILVYLQPHPQAPGPFYHDRAAYDAFAAETRSICAAAGADYEDWETRVPLEFWGTTNEGKLDVFHFREEGHRRLGRAVADWLVRTAKR